MSNSFISTTLRQSPLHARSSPFRHDPAGLALLLQSIHADLPARASSLPDRAHVTDAFLWLFPCCEDGTRIGDTLNRMHVAGLLFCKLCHHDLHGTTPPSFHPAHLYPAHPRVHIVDRCVWDMPLSECLTLLLAIQHDWRLLLRDTPDTAPHGVLACAARLAHLASGRHPAAVLDMEEHVEPGGDSASRLLTRKALRSALTTVHGLLRAWVLHVLAQPVVVVDAETEPEHSAPGVHARNPACREQTLKSHLGYNAQERLSRQTLRKIHAIWRRREASSAVSAEDVAWQDLARCLDPVSIGEAPRKSTPGMRAVVRAARSLGGAVAASVDGEAGKAEVPAAALQAVVEAMRFYYVLPAATTFRALALQESILPGQRLNYALDFQHFDTGQLSQVVYLHNPLYTARAPPTMVEEWDSVSGPLAAFAQLHTGVQIWSTDAEDPLGILGHRTAITRAAHHTAPPEPGVGDARFSQWVFVLNAVGLYLVDRGTGQIFAPEDGDDIGVTLLAWFCVCLDMAKATAGVAVNSYRTFHAIE